MGVVYPLWRYINVTLKGLSHEGNQTQDTVKYSTISYIFRLLCNSPIFYFLLFNNQHRRSLINMS